MSRIEKALAKAAQMRASAAGAAISAPPYAEGDLLSGTGEPAVDPTRVDRRIVCITDPRSLAAEQYRKLRARIVSATRTEGLNTLMIAGPDGGEGKTVTAINLAVAFAREIDQSVLLVDADLRNPSVHTYLGIRPQRGLSDCLRNEADLAEVLVRTGIGRLFLLPAGSRAENPAELMASERMRSLVRELKGRDPDRVVLFDSSPVLPAADALSLAGCVDGIIFVVQAAKTSPKAAATALSLFKGRAVLGSVFNNVPDYLVHDLHSCYQRYQDGLSSEQAEPGNGGEPALPGEAAHG
jgi:protein-tyrosine kinase